MESPEEPSSGNTLSLPPPSVNPANSQSQVTYDMPPSYEEVMQQQGIYYNSDASNRYEDEDDKAALLGNDDDEDTFL
jgi:capsular polysaccharide biosynthesis protein